MKSTGSRKFWSAGSALVILGLAAGAVWYQSVCARATENLPVRTLIVAGGPTIALNQYAIGSNARYVEKLTAKSLSQRILFADGHRDEKIITTFEPYADADARKVFGWMFNDKPDFQGRAVLKASGLTRVDGPSTGSEVIDSCKALGQSVHAPESGFVYFTGHGSPDPNQAAEFAGRGAFPGTAFALWGNERLGVPNLAQSFQNWPADRPLVLVMAQCYSGGFANLIFKDGLPDHPVRDWDFAGFFSATGDREAAGCTPEVDEFDYQDFTTHFFAALSGITRDGTPLKGADLDKDGQVSMLEAYAWANVHDDSVDVPLCTSDFYLRQTVRTTGDDWMKTPLAKIQPSAQPWQKSILQGLAKELGLEGEDSLFQAIKQRAGLMQGGNESTAQPGIGLPAALKSKAAIIGEQMSKLHDEVIGRFPAMALGPQSPQFQAVKPEVLLYLSKRSTEVAPLARAFDAVLDSQMGKDVRISELTRYVRACRSVILEDLLVKQGTEEQRAVLARLRKSESRNPLS